ncbi:MAG: hypothetical protein SCH66_03285 [Methanolobus sp.]|nr:hypothetical protein [Methanolobus sp.]
MKNKDKWNVAGIVLFLLGVTVGLIDYFVNSNDHSLGLILISVATLFASISILSKHNLPVLKLLAGISLTLALFSQAYFIESLFSAVLGLVMFFTSAVEYKKDISRTGQ